MLSQQLLSMAPQSIKVVTSQITHCQRLKGSVEVVCTLKAQQGLFEVAPPPDLWRRTKEKRKKKQIMANRKRKKTVKGQSLSFCKACQCKMLILNVT